MSVRRLPVRPDLDQLRRQAKDLLRDIHAGATTAVGELREFHPEPLEPTAAKLSDAQLVLACSYEASSWTRLAYAVQLADAIWGSADDVRREPPVLRPRPVHRSGNPVHGTTLLHIATSFDELAVAEWLLDRSMNPDAPSAVDADGFGGYTALYSSVVSQRGFWVNYGKGQSDEARFARVGRTVPCTTLREPRGASVDRGQWRRPMILEVRSPR